MIWRTARPQASASPGTQERSRAARHQAVTLHRDAKLDHHAWRSINGASETEVPTNAIRAKCLPYPRRYNSHYSILAQG